MLSLSQIMERNGILNVISAAIDQGRPTPAEIVPGSVLHHFLYKSRANVQFTMSSDEPEFSSVSRRRRYYISSKTLISMLISCNLG